MKATEKQVNYVIYLAGKKNMSVNWMNSSWKPYASMRERNGKVIDFLTNLERSEISRIIEELK